MDIETSMRQILEAESNAIRNIPYSPDFDRAVELILEHVHRRRGKLVTSGMGKAGQIAMNIATTFSSTGIPAVNLHPSEAQHGDLGVMQPDDLLLLLSQTLAAAGVLWRLPPNLENPPKPPNTSGPHPDRI